MKRFSKLFTKLAIALVVFAGAAAAYDIASDGYPVTSSVTADDVSAAIAIRYVGSEVSGKASVASGDITLVDGAAGAEAADTSIECPLAAPFAGVIDVDNAACDTVGEVLDVINSTSGSQWRAYPVAALRSDSLAGAKLVAVSAASANGPDGLALPWDTSVVLQTGVVLGFPSQGLGSGVKYSDYFTADNKLRANPFFGRFVQVNSVDALATYTGAGALEIHEIAFNPSPLTNKSTETVTLASTRVLPGATGVWGNVTYNNGFGIFLKPDTKVLVRAKAATTFSAAQVLASGRQYRVR